MKLSLKAYKAYVIAQLGKFSKQNRLKWNIVFLPKNTYQKRPTKISALCGSLISMGETLLSDSFKWNGPYRQNSKYYNQCADEPFLIESSNFDNHLQTKVAKKERWDLKLCNKCFQHTVLSHRYFNINRHPNEPKIGDPTCKDTEFCLEEVACEIFQL